MNEFMRKFDDKYKAENEFLTSSLQNLFGSDLDKACSSLAVIIAAIVLGGHWRDKTNLLPLILDRLHQTLENPSEQFLSSPHGAGFSVDKIFDEAGIRNKDEIQALKEMFHGPSTRTESSVSSEPSADHGGRARFRWW